MAITKQDLLNELRELHQQQNDMTRKMLALTLKVQNMQDVPPMRGEFTSQELLAAHALATKVGGNGEGLAAIEATMQKQGMQLPAERTLLKVVVPEGENPEQAVSAAIAQARVAAPHPNDGVLVDGHTTQPKVAHVWQLSHAAPETPAPKSPIEAALASAQSLLKQAMTNAGLPEATIALIDQVTVDHLSKKAPTVSGADFVVPEADRKIEQPTEAAPTQPTEAQAEAEVAQGILSAFIGRGSIFMDHLHSSMLFGACGELQAGYELPDGKPLKRFENDAYWTEERNLRKWPVGFYLDRDTKQLQFLVNTDQFALLLTALPSEVSPVKVIFYGMDGWKDIGDYSLNEQKLIHAKTSDTLVGLKKK
jgi:hypothetical protein